MKIYLYSFFLSFSFNFLFLSTSTANHFYIEITETSYEIGRYSKNDFKKIPITSFLKEATDIKKVQEILVESDKKKNVLFYFHSMWGSVQPYHKNSLKQLNKIVGIEKIISIEWHTDWRYKKSWEKVIHQGEKLSPIIQQLISNKQHQYFVLCHSMGHRIFEGVVKEIPETQSIFKAVFFAAADLNVTVFSENLKKLPTISQQIIVYIHKKVRLLKLSKWIHKRERLGLNADDNKERFKVIPNLEIVNITKSKNRKKLSASNHIYFKTNKDVFKDINLVVTEQKMKRKETFKVKEGNYIVLK